MKIIWLALLLAFESVYADPITFPKDFQWCVATSGHQVEGDNINSDWWAWEQKPGTIKNGDRSGHASFHMARMEEDVKIMKDMGVKTYRFSIEWSRIEPKEGEFSAEGIAHYAKELKLLKQAGIAPMVTMHHFTQPQWFTASGGWKRDDAPEIFLRYVKKLDQEFGKDVVYWVTFNEPGVILISGYGFGVMPPGEKKWDYIKPAVQILKAHGLAYHYMHEQASKQGRVVKIGMAFHIRPMKAGQWFITRPLSFVDDILNWSMPLALKTGVLTGVARKDFIGLPFPKVVEIPIAGIKDTQDFFGLNYYTRELVTISLGDPHLRRDPFPGLEASELNWGIDPEGFYEVLKLSHKHFPNLPFFITENGIADAHDKWRAKYVIDHLAQLHRAMVDFHPQIEGYCHWSLMDNFEWNEGFSQRFGLIEVDYKNEGKRTPRPSAAVVTKIFKTGSLPEDAH